MAKIALNVSVVDPNRFKTALAEAKSLGLHVDMAYEDLGVASGSADSAVLQDLRRIQGLVLEADRVVRTMPAPRSGSHR